MAVSSRDIEILWKRYSEEASKRGISVIQFFESNGVPYHVFEKWYKKKFTQPAVVIGKFHQKDPAIMFSLTGATKYKYIPNYKDMRGGYDKLCGVIRTLTGPINYYR